MSRGPWRCRQCGTVNDAEAHACRSCGRWPSVFDLQDSALPEEEKEEDLSELGPQPDPVPLEQEPGQRAAPPGEERVEERPSAGRGRARLRRLARLIPIAVFLAILAVNAVRSTWGSSAPQRVTSEQVAATAGLTPLPFAGSRACDVYVVPLDKPSETDAAVVARDLARRTRVVACVTPSFALTPEIVDEVRHQVSAALLVDRLANLDRMRPRLAEPPPSASELRRARERFLAGGQPVSASPS